jgi:hypothetical protein
MNAESRKEREESINKTKKREKEGNGERRKGRE